MNEKLQKHVVEELKKYIERIENGEIQLESSKLDRPYIEVNTDETFEIRTYTIEYIEWFDD